MYLVVSKKGFFVSLSKAAAEAKCRPLGVEKSSIVEIESPKTLLRCLKFYNEEVMMADIKIGELKLWNPVRRSVWIDFCCRGNLYFLQ